MSYEDENMSDDMLTDDDTNLVKKLRAKIDELSARNKELEGEFSRVQAVQREQTLSELLAARGYAPKVSKFVPETVDSTDEGIDAWLSEFGDAFTPVSTPQAEPQQTVVVSNAAQAETLRRMQAAESAGQVAAPAPAGDVLGRIQAAQNMDELVAALRGA